MMKRNGSGIGRFWAAHGCIGIGLVSFAGGASAQETLEQVIVTASKRGDVAIQDTPFALQALEGSSLEESGARDMAGFFRQIPGLAINDQGPGDKNYIIRGIYSSGAGTVGLYFDEIIITGEGSDIRGKAPDPKLFDINRIEVLKGPQGTTFGSSSLSGTIRWMPNTPRYDAIEMNVGGGLTSLKESNDLGWQADGMVNIPIVQDKVAVRFAGFVSNKAGYLDNRFLDDANSEKSTAVRAMLSWRVTDDLEFSTFAMLQDMVVGARSFFNDTTASLPLSPTLNGQPLPKWYQASLSRESGHEEEMTLFNAKLVLSKPWGTVTGSYSIYDRQTDTKRDTPWASEILFGYPADQNPAYLGAYKDRRVSTSEIRFSSDWDSPFQVLTGVFFQKEDRLDTATYVFTDPFTGRATDATEAAHRDTYHDQEEFAVFGEVSWDITEKLTLTAGARWFDMKVNEQVNTITLYVFQPGAGYEDPLSFEFKDTIFKGNLSYKFTDDTLVYAQVAEGYRAGGPNDQAPMRITDVIIPQGFESDSVINYELGLKTSHFNNRLIVNSAVYYIDWTDIQLQLNAQNSQGLSFTYRGNGGKARVRGVEVDIAAVPVEGLRVGASFNYMKGELTEDMPPPQLGFKGDSLPYSPEMSGSVNIRYGWPVSDELKGFVGGDWSYVGKSYTQLTPRNRDYRELADYSILNLRAGVEGDDWSLVFSVDNALDSDETIFYANDFGTGANLGSSFFPENKVRPWPRSLSIMFRKKIF